jgi:hypothetical protein
MIFATSAIGLSSTYTRRKTSRSGADSVLDAAARSALASAATAGSVPPGAKASPSARSADSRDVVSSGSPVVAGPRLRSRNAAWLRAITHSQACAAPWGL